MRGDRRGQPFAGEGGRGRGRATGHDGLPRSSRRSAARTHATEGEAGGDGSVPRRGDRCAHLDDGDRGRRGHPERDGDAGRGRRAVRFGAAPPAPRPDRPRSAPELLRAVRRDRIRRTRKRGRASTRWSRTNDGFELADEDLRLRGEGTLFDTKQSGMPDLKLARLAEDLELVRRARRRAFALIEDDPHLDAHPALLRELRARFEARSTGCSGQDPVRRLHGSAGVGVGSADAGDRREREGDAARPGPTRRPSGLRPCPRGRVLEPGAGCPGLACLDLYRGDGRDGDRGALPWSSSAPTFVDRATRPRRRSMTTWSGRG